MTCFLSQLGLYVLGEVSEAVGIEMEPHFSSMFELYANCLAHHANPEVSSEMV